MRTVDYFTNPDNRKYATPHSDPIPLTPVHTEEDIAEAKAHLAMPKPESAKSDEIEDECVDAIHQLSLLEAASYKKSWEDFNQEASLNARSQLFASQDEFLADKLRLELGKLQMEVDVRNYGWTVCPWREQEGSIAFLYS